MKNVLLFPMGSSGDVHPLIGLGRVLKERGHRVTIFTCEVFGPTAIKSGLEFVSTYSTEEYHAIQQDPRIWDPKQGTRFVLEHTQSLDSYRQCLQMVQERLIPNETTLVCGTLALAPRIVRDYLKIPLVTVHLQPAVIVSPEKPARMATGNLPLWWPVWLRRFVYKLGEKCMIDPIIAPTINAFRKELGLPPVRNILSQFWHSPDAVVTLFPEWYAPPATDWPKVQFTSFPLYDEANVHPLSEEHRQFIEAGDPPVVVTFGSAMRHAKPYFTAVAEAIHSIGRRGMLLTPYREQIPESLPEGVIHADYIPLSQILSKAGVMVHHGGIGTASQALAAGCPQLVMPMNHDQPDNAERLEKLGLARWIWPKNFKPTRIANALKELLTTPAIKESAMKIAERLRQEHGLLDAAQIVETTRFRE